ncbi:MAG: hypothetical protein ACRD8U_06330 [Pyrinomonadaceae bacterium]
MMQSSGIHPRFGSSMRSGWLETIRHRLGWVVDAQLEVVDTVGFDPGLKDPRGKPEYANGWEVQPRLFSPRGTATST